MGAREDFRLDLRTHTLRLLYRDVDLAEIDPTLVRFIARLCWLCFQLGVVATVLVAGLMALILG